MNESEQADLYYGGHPSKPGNTFDRIWPKNLIFRFLEFVAGSSSILISGNRLKILKLDRQALPHEVLKSLLAQAKL